jgi:hypothetical protein
MVKMFIVRKDLNIITGADVNGLTNRIPALMKIADTEYQKLLLQAIEFCNLDIGSSSDKERVALCKYVKKNMRAL